MLPKKGKIGKSQKQKTNTPPPKNNNNNKKILTNTKIPKPKSLNNHNIVNTVNTLLDSNSFPSCLLMFSPQQVVSTSSSSFGAA